MKVAITDANIFIDLHCLEILDHLFLLDLEIHTTIEVIDELDDDQVESLMKREGTGELIVYSMNSDELGALRALALSNGLSQTDKALFYYSQKIKCLVLTGDRKLRQTIEQSGREVHGIIWLFDQWLEAGILIKSDAADKLRELILINPFLRIKECLDRIDAWSE